MNSYHENEHEEKAEVGDTATLQIYIYIQIPKITFFFLVRKSHILANLQAVFYVSSDEFRVTY